MRLINIRTLELEEFVQGSIPPYAILSHRWTSEELNFEEVAKKRVDTHKKGYEKLIGACRAAANYDVNYIWIDSCCIDKSSSAELSEAINSMFSWYEKAEVCIAYLEGIKAGDETEFRKTLKGSVWFTRAWTLQELLAPRHVDFYGDNWGHFGSKDYYAAEIEELTGIDTDVLKKECPLWQWSVAERMAWAAERESTLPEDTAYSLMGIFEVNMPLIYGEGSKAFTRLQEEILRHSNDATFLLWGLNATTHRLLAGSPADFRDFRSMDLWRPLHHEPLVTINVGLEIYSDIIRWELDVYGLIVAYGDGHRLAVLVRRAYGSDALYRIGVAKADGKHLRWQRARRSLFLWGDDGKLDHVDIHFKYGITELDWNGFVIENETSLPLSTTRLQQGGFHPRDELFTAVNDETCFSIEFKDPTAPSAARLEFQTGKNSTLSIDLCFDFDSRPCALLFTGKDGRWVWEVSDRIKEPTSFVGKSIECKMISTFDDETESESFLFRSFSRHVDNVAQVPEQSMKDDWLQMKFTPPKTGSRFWKFCISPSRSSWSFEAPALQTPAYLAGEVS